MKEHGLLPGEVNCKENRNCHKRSPIAQKGRRLVRTLTWSFNDFIHPTHSKVPDVDSDYNTHSGSGSPAEMNGITRGSPDINGFSRGSSKMNGRARPSATPLAGDTIFYTQDLNSKLTQLRRDRFKYSGRMVSTPDFQNNVSSHDASNSIFNKHLPGPNNEGLLWVRDDVDNAEAEPAVQVRIKEFIIQLGDRTNVEVTVY